MSTKYQSEVKYILIPLLFCLASCSFNKSFLKPTPLPRSLNRIDLKTDKDTTILKFIGNNHQPIFTNISNDNLDLDYTIESVLFKSSSGNILNGWLIKPTSTNNITLIHFHGNAGFVVSNSNLMLPLVKKGFTVFTVDYSGFGFSTGKATRKNVLQDALSTIDYLNNREDLKETKKVLYGQSLGGHLSVVVANKREVEIDGLVIEGAFSSHSDIASEQAGFLGRIFVKELYSAKESIKNYHKPILIIHSNEDETIPLEHGRALFKLANQPKEFLEIDNCHLCGLQYYSDNISELILNWFSQE